MCDGLVSRIVASEWFNQTWAPFVLLDANARIRGVNLAYELVTGHTQDWLLGANLFEAFPDNPSEPAADGVARLSQSLETAWRGRRDWMPYHRHDVRDPDQPDSFAFKVWAPVNVPVEEDGRVVAVLHHVQDVTVIVRGVDPARVAGSSRDELDAVMGTLVREFPEVPPETILGLLTDSERLVLRTLGSLDAAEAAELARLRLELRTGRSAGHEAALSTEPSTPGNDLEAHAPIDVES